MSLADGHGVIIPEMIAGSEGGVESDKRTSHEIDWTPRLLAQKTFTGLTTLGAKEVIVGIVSVIGSTLLARLLSPAAFGLFAILTFAVGFLSAFGNVGIGASLIAMPTVPTLKEYRAVFTIEQLMGLGVVVVMWILSPVLASAYHLADGSVWMFRAVSGSMWLSSFRTVSAIQLERKLEIRDIARVEMVGVVAYYGSAVALAWSGFGAWSFVWAILIRTTLTSVLSFAISPWLLGWGGLNRAFWSRHIRFGAMYQASSVVSLFKDSFTPIIVGIILGTQAVGYVKWASTLAVYSLIVLMGLNRIYFPALSRLKAFPAELRVFIEKVVWGTNSVVAPIAVWLVLFVRPVTEIIYGTKWKPAIPLFYLFWGANILVPTATPIFSLFNAMGQTRRTLMFAIIWAVGEWGLGLPLILLYGPIGIAIANLVVQGSNLILIRMGGNLVQSQLLLKAWPPWGLSLIVGLLIEPMVLWHPIQSLLQLFFYGCGWLLLYAGLWFGLYRKDLAWVARAVRRIG